MFTHSSSDQDNKFMLQFKLRHNFIHKIKLSQLRSMYIRKVLPVKCLLNFIV